MIEYCWSCRLGKFVDKVTGKHHHACTAFNGSQREWHETLIEVTYDVVNTLIRCQLARPQDLQLLCSEPVLAMYRDSVLHGHTSSTGLHLMPVCRPDNGRWVDFVDVTTGEVVARIEVLDLP